MTNKQWSLILAGALFVGLVIVAVKSIPAQRPPPVAESAPQNECAINAALQHANAKIARAQKWAQQPVDVANLLSVSSTIAQRRQEENFCLQFAQCLFPDPTVQLYALQLGTTFHNCLRDEALEEYDAIAR
jgi:hypothetical protein